MHLGNNMSPSSKKFLKHQIVESHDVDPFYNLKLANLFVYFQDVVTEHMERLGINKTIINDKGMYWVVTRYKVHINRLPKYLEEVDILTYPGKDMRFIFPRFFEILDKKGNVLVKASSTWMVLDKKNKQIVIKPFDESLLYHHSEEGELPLPHKIDDKEGSIISKRTVLLSDLDLNNHLNNTKYIEFITDSLGYDFAKDNEICDFEINFNKEIAYSKEVFLTYFKDGNNIYIDGIVNKEVAFKSKITFVKCLTN